MTVLDVNFNVFGGRDTASSRLRAWNIADELTRQGHRATVGGARIAPVEVFQKVRHGSRLAEALDRGSTVIYDFDDHYLLDSVGTRDELLRFFARADSVSAGSAALVEEAARHHDRVWLFENPLDVARGSRPRSDAPWRGAVGWLGNRANLESLEFVDAGRRVTTVTQRGDIEWSLNSVDGAVAAFDLVLIPVLPSEWTAAKNANRLLKCVALAVPVLASRTPEHERIVKEFGLPGWLLLDAEDSWAERIERAQDEFGDLLAAFGTAREAAHRRYGIEPVTRRWIQSVAATAAPVRLAPRRRVPVDADVVVFSDAATEEDMGATLQGLRAHEFEFRSVTVVSALPLGPDTALPATAGVLDRHEDYFDVYPALASALGGGRAPRVLYLRAGVRLTRSFFSLGLTCDADRGFQLFGLEPGGAAGDTLRPPEGLPGLLARPYDPPMALIHREAYASAGGLDPAYLGLALWELLLRLAPRSGNLLVSMVPVAVSTSRGLDRHPLHGYSDFLRRRSPELLGELPDADREWERLRFVLHAAIVEAHRELFGAHIAAILPTLAAATGSGAVVSAGRPTEGGLDRRIWEVLDRRGVAPGLRLPVRTLWRALRPFVPDETRVRAYRRYRALYELFFPERRPPRRRR